MQRYIVLIMELLGPGISDSIETKARYYGMHWDIVGDNDGIYDKMADMFMAISCDPKICLSGLRWVPYSWTKVGLGYLVQRCLVENFGNPRHPRQFDIPLRVDRLIWRMYLPQHECWRGRKRNESLAPQPGGFSTPFPMSEEDHRTIGF